MNPREVLNAARAAVIAGKFAEALEKYEYFFEHALDVERSFYGVRLSYCLDEWADLGQKYPPALQRLEAKAKSSLELLSQTREPERFHDYVEICRYLEREDESIDRFIEIDKSDFALAQSIMKFVWDELVEREQWAVCSRHLHDPGVSYNRALAKFDEALQISRSEPSLGGEEFEQQVKGWCVRDLHNILLVLKGSDRRDEFDSLKSRIESDMKSRGHEELIQRVIAEI